jgi:hypothetical protein
MDKLNLTLQNYKVEFISDNKTMKLALGSNITLDIDESSQVYEIRVYNLTQDYSNITMHFTFGGRFANALTTTKLTEFKLAYLTPS